jgi:protein-S-isoprenylcysteine O-methyltransferase Ste14
MDGLVPVLLLGVFIGVGVCWRSWLHRRRFGGSGIVLFQSGRWDQHLREASLLVLGALLVAQAIAALVAPSALEAMRVLPSDDTTWWLGVTLMLAGTALMVVAQLDMGASWRFGLDESARPGLVVVGLYRICRNPIYVAVFTTMAGYALLLPTWLSWALLLSTIVGVRRQVFVEEAYLLRTYGDAYATYAHRVGRFVPTLGRLS